jgi:hypothetical protein
MIWRLTPSLSLSFSLSPSLPLPLSLSLSLSLYLSLPLPLSPKQAITIIGPPECCTEACYQIMKIMQNELLMTSGMLDAG